MGTCTTCHDTPNVGDHSVAVPLNIGTSDYPARPGLDLTGLPVYTLRCNATGASVQTTDPGRALISGKCADIGKVKGPILRGLAARAPYFHNGSAATLDDVVDFYNHRFDIGLTPQEKADLVAFLKAL
jgi:cytochrome c peroxidase